MSRLCLVVLVAWAVAAQEVSRQAYIKHGIIPDVLSVPPEEYLTVQYPSGARVEEGNELTPTQVKDNPALIWNASPDKFYTVVMADPDAQSRALPTSRNMLHWLAGNVPGTDIASGEAIAEYIGSGPLLASGLHRYVFLVYLQPSKLEFDEPRITNRSIVNRPSFSIAKFAKKYNLGDPIAGNFYQAEWDEYVPLLYLQLVL